MNKNTSIVQENGQVTLPAWFRKKHGIKKGDAVIFKETDEGLLISPREALVMNLLDEIETILQAQGIDLDELIASGWIEREEMLHEQRNSELDHD